MHGEQHGFPGMLGSIDCMHWEWKNYPTAWKGAYTTGYKSKNPTIILEAVADYRLWIWHAYFGVAGSNNDINVLNSLPLFNEQCQGIGPAVSFVANGNRHDMGYYLADGIYPRWPVFVKTISTQMMTGRPTLRNGRSRRTRTWSAHLVCSSLDGRQLRVQRVCGMSDAFPR